MKIIATAIFCVMNLYAIAQDDTTSFAQARSVISKMHDEAIKDSLLMTNRGLNVFMAKKVSTYLSGSSDLSLNKGYFILDPTDGRLLLAYNTAIDPSSDERRTKWIFTGGVKTDVADAFSTLYSGDKKLAANIGASIKFTLLGRGIIGYNGNNLQAQPALVSQTKKMLQSETGKNLRIKTKNVLNKQMEDDSTEFENSLTGTDSEFRNTDIPAFYKGKNKGYIKKFIESESDNIEEAELYNYFWNHWVSLDLYIPFTSQEYDAAKDFTTTVKSQKLYNFEASVIYSQIREWKKNRMLTTLNFGAKNQNNINTSVLDKHTVSDYKKLGGIDTITLAQLESKEIYIGNYEKYFSPFARIQIVDYFLAQKSIGISIQVEKYFGSYNPLNLKLGIPFTLAGKDDETKVSFEVQFKWNDFGNNILPGKSRSDKFLVGLSVGVPLSSKIY